MSGTYNTSVQSITKGDVETKVRTLGQSYLDPSFTNGWDANIRPAENIEIGFDEPNDSGLPSRGGSATTTWTANEYLVCDGVVIYQVSWTMTQSAATFPKRTYSVTSQGPATQITGNPEKMSVGNDRSGNAIEVTNPAHVAPSK